MRTGELVIGRLRVKSRGLAASLAAGLRPVLEKSIAAGMAVPPGMPPASILLVRRLAGTASVTRNMGVIDWGRSAGEAMLSLYRNADRPRDGTLRGSGEAVLFRDASELMACLALDLGRAPASERWFWRAYFKSQGRSAGSGPAAALSGDVRRLPAILEHLVAWGKAVPVLAGVDPASALRLSEGIAAAWNWKPWADLAAWVPDWKRASWAPFDAEAGSRRATNPSPSAASGNPLAEARDANRDRQGESAESAMRAWRGFWAAVPGVERLTAEQILLLGLARMAAHSPQLGRQAALCQAIRDWYSDGHPRKGGRDGLPVDSSPGRNAFTGPSPQAGGRRGPAGKQSAGGTPVGEDGHSVDEPALEAGSPDRGGNASAPGPAGGTEGAASPQTGAGKPGRRDPQRPGEAVPEAFAPMGNGNVSHGDGGIPGNGSDPQAAQAGFGEQSIPAQEAGLALPDPARIPLRGAAARTRPWLTGIETAVYPTRLGGIFYLINVMTRLGWPAALAGEGPEPGPWALLEGLAWRLIGIGGTDGREGGDVDRDPVWDLLRDLDGRDAAEQPGAGGECFPGIMGRAAPLALAHLRRWLNGDGTSFLHCPARVFATASHLDAVFRLADISLPARMAGLDRDPSWLPAFGRVIQFHFEE